MYGEMKLEALSQILFMQKESHSILTFCLFSEKKEKVALMHMCDEKVRTIIGILIFLDPKVVMVN